MNPDLVFLWVGSICLAAMATTLAWTYYYLFFAVRHPDLDRTESPDDDIDGIPINVPVRWRDQLRVVFHLSIKEDHVPDTKLLVYTGNLRNWKRLTHAFHLKDIPERILGAAIRHPDGLIYGVGYNGRHHHCIRYMHSLGKAGLATTKDQGFVTSRGRYVDRWEALAIAQSADQLIRKTPPHDRLFSEDLW